MLITLKEAMSLAQEKEIAIGAFNAANLEGLQAIVEAAEELQLPVIIQFAQCHERWIPLAVMGPIMMESARRASVPICVHLDHGEDLDYLHQALEIGFTGIMYDGSTLPYEENLANTQKAVDMAARYGASVEAELGSMGRRESGAGEGGTGLLLLHFHGGQRCHEEKCAGRDDNFRRDGGSILLTPSIPFLGTTMGTAMNRRERLLTAGAELLL